MKPAKSKDEVRFDNSYSTVSEVRASPGQFELSCDCRQCQKEVLPQVIFTFGVCDCGSPQLTAQSGQKLDHDELARALMGYLEYLMENKVSRRMRG